MSAAVSELPGPNVTRAFGLGVFGLRRPHRMAWELYRRYGTIAQIGMLGRRYVCVFGEKANRLILAERPDIFRGGDSFESLRPLLGPSALPLLDGLEHRERRRIVQPVFGRPMVDLSVETLGAITDAHINEMRTGETVELHRLLRYMIGQGMAHVLFGPSLVSKHSGFAAAIEPALRYIQRPPELQFKYLPAHRSALRARRAADRIVDRDIRRRRVSGETGRDALGYLLASDLTDDEIRDQAVSLAAGGYAMTPAAGSCILLELLRSYSTRERLIQEIEKVVGPRTLPTPSHLRAMPLLTAVVNEGLRLWPSAVLVPRTSTEEFEFEGWRIPPGSRVLYSPYVTQRMEEYWGYDADAFLPHRWLDADPVSPFVYIPFGGGRRHCIAGSLAETAIKVAVVRLLQRVRMELLHPGRRVEFTGIHGLHPSGSVRVRVLEVDPHRP